MKFFKMLFLLMMFFTTYSTFCLETPPLYKKTPMDFVGHKGVSERYFTFQKDYSEEAENELVDKMGGCYPPSTKIRHRVTYDNNILSFDVNYDIDKFGQRRFDNSKYKGTKKEHFILAGDSNTFGMGVSDDDIMLAVMARKFPQYNYYNFGIAGAGPHNTLAMMQNFPWNKQITPESGNMVYIYYMSWMPLRAIGTKESFTYPQMQDPWYGVVDGKLVRRGNLPDQFIAKIYKIINFIDYFHWVGDLPKLNEDHMHLTAKIFEKMKEEYLLKFPKGKFMVAVSDYDSYYDPILVKTLIKDLKNLGVEASLINKNTKKVSALHLVDNHFNRDGQIFIAGEISKIVGLDLKK